MLSWYDERGGRRPLFRDRREAGAALADPLLRYRGAHPVILGIPRGGVVLAAEIANRLQAPLDVVVARKLGSPYSSEAAIGAVTASGDLYLDQPVIEQLMVPAEFIRTAAAREQAVAQRREREYRAGRARVPLRHRTAIVVDDGLATGSTMRAAVRAARRERPAYIVVAVPVGAREACDALREDADAVLCLHELTEFRAVGLYYLDFEPTSDETVRSLMRGAPVRHPNGPLPETSVV